MKRILLILLMFAFLTFIVPIATIYLMQTKTNKALLPQSFLGNNSGQSVAATENVLVFDEATNQILTLSLRDFLIGSVAAEMPAEYNEQAIKAQAIACHSYAKATLAVNSQKEGFNGAWRNVNTVKKEGYITQEAMQALWQERFEEYYKKIETCVDEVINKTCVYNGEIALTSYHAISNGQTENSKNVWQNELPYLVGTDSMLDVTSPDFLATQNFTPQQMVDILSINFTGLSLIDDPSTWIKEIIYSPAGYATEIKMNNDAIISAQDFRKALGLRSTAIEIEYADDRFVITTKGYGHGVGLSQYGANAMALTGKTYTEILQHYFKDVDIIG